MRGYQLVVSEVVLAASFSHCWAELREQTAQGPGRTQSLAGTQAVKCNRVPIWAVTSMYLSVDGYMADIEKPFQLRHSCCLNIFLSYFRVHYKLLYMACLISIVCLWGSRRRKRKFLQLFMCWSSLFFLFYFKSLPVFPFLYGSLWDPPFQLPSGTFSCEEGWTHLFLETKNTVLLIIQREISSFFPSSPFTPSSSVLKLEWHMY